MSEISGVASLIEGELAQHVALPLYKTGYLTTFSVAKDVPALRRGKNTDASATSTNLLKKPRVAKRACVTVLSLNANMPRREKRKCGNAEMRKPKGESGARGVAMFSAFPPWVRTNQKKGGSTLERCRSALWFSSRSSSETTCSWLPHACVRLSGGACDDDGACDGCLRPP